VRGWGNKIRKCYKRFSNLGLGDTDCSQIENDPLDLDQVTELDREVSDNIRAQFDQSDLIEGDEDFNRWSANLDESGRVSISSTINEEL
jgi:hypothetical protein